MERVRAAWASMLGVEEMQTQVVVREHSTFAPPGWVSLVRIDDAVIATVLDAVQATAVGAALEGLTALESVDVDVLRSRLDVVDVLGPSSLFYLLAPIAAPEDVDVVGMEDVGDLIAAVPAADLDESGVQHVDGGLSVVRDEDGVPVAACGSMRWPASIGHLCVLTHPDHRGRGLAKRVAAHAAARAEADGLLAQWRARVEASKAVARAIGFEERGTQLRVLLG